MSVFCGNGFSFPLGKKTYVMGILNITPDSFSDGGKYSRVSQAVEHALQMERDGADIIDIGGQSTRPNSVKITAAEELYRISSIIEVLKGKLTVPISIDTFEPSVAEWCLNNGAKIINDVSGTIHIEMYKVVKEHSAGYIIMHSENLDSAIKDKLLWLTNMAERQGVKRESICLDIGIGFNKETEDNIYILKNLKEIKPQGYPLLVGASRKRFIGAISGEENAAERDAGTIAAHTIAIAGGADIIRVHNVKEAVQAAKVADQIMRGTYG